MSLEAAFYAYVTAQSSVTDIVGDRVYQDVMPQTETYPAIVYSLISENRSESGYSLTGANGQVESRLQVTCYSNTRPKVARQLYDALRMRLNGFKGLWGGTEIQSCFIDSAESTVDQQPGNAQARVYGYSVDLLITHVESVPTFI